MAFGSPEARDILLSHLLQDVVVGSEPEKFFLDDTLRRRADWRASIVFPEKAFSGPGTKARKEARFSFLPFREPASLNSVKGGKDRNMEKMTLKWLPKVVISIVGDCDTGKSRLLREFAQNLKWDDIHQVFHGKKCADWRTKDKNDIRIGGLYNGVKVAIMTGGDDADTIIRAFLYVQEWKCDILIIATHPAHPEKGSPISWISLEAVTMAYGIECISIKKQEASDADRECVTKQLYEALTKVMASLK